MTGTTLTESNSNSSKFALQAGGGGGVNPGTAYLERMVPSAKETQRSALRRVVLVLTGAPGDPEAYPWASLSHAEVTRLRAALVTDLAPRTCNRYLSAIRQTLTEAWAAGELDADALGRLKFVLRNVRARQLARGRVVSDREVEDLFRVCATDPTPAGPRDGAMLALMIGAGLRRQEVSSLNVGDVQLDAQIVKVMGKGHAERVVSLGTSVVVWLTRWLDVRGRDGEVLFPPVRQRKIRAGRISPAAVWFALGKRGRQAGVGRSVGPHDCRRTRATQLLQHGVDLGVVGRLLGHQNLATTLLYDQRGRSAEAQAADLVPLPLPDDLLGGTHAKAD
jgi:integrase/recombinase XerD